jgi:hypothetical protein
MSSKEGNHISKQKFIHLTKAIKKSEDIFSRICLFSCKFCVSATMEGEVIAILEASVLEEENEREIQPIGMRNARERNANCTATSFARLS